LLRNNTMEFEGELLLSMLQDISQGIRFLHTTTPTVIHGDLKSVNILVDIRFRAKLSDFGLSTTRGMANVATGTPYWMAPELFQKEQ
jgi:serine/threonine protein kinase